MTPGSVAILGLTPAITPILVWTDLFGLHDLLLVETTIDQINGNVWMLTEYGPWYYVHAGYAILLTVVAIGLFLVHSVRTSGAVAARARLFALNDFFPLLGSGLYVAEVTRIDWGPVTAIVSGLLIIFATFYY